VSVGSSAAGTLRVTIQRLSPGRKVGKRCKRPTHALRKRPRCTRATTVATFSHALSAGTTQITIPRKIGRLKLPACRCRAVLTPLDAAGHAGKNVTVGFRVA